MSIPTSSEYWKDKSFQSSDFEGGIRTDSDNFQNKSDEEIWLEFKSGNEDAFIFLYDNYFDSLAKYGLNFSSNRELVLDCLQDMFIDLREKRKTITKTDDIKPMLFKIFRRRINHYLRKINKEVSHHKIVTQSQFEITVSHEYTLIERQLSRDQIAAINKAMQVLSTKEREVIYQYYYENMSYEQIAQVMGYTQIKTARTLVYRALKSIRSVLDPQQKQIFYLLF